MTFRWTFPLEAFEPTASLIRLCTNLKNLRDIMHPHDYLKDTYQIRPAMRLVQSIFVLRMKVADRGVSKTNLPSNIVPPGRFVTNAFANKYSVTDIC
jgi:hypothetical protein